MAKTVAPLLSFSAGGQIAKTQVYSEWKGRPYVRRYVIPANPNTTGQQATRNAFKFLNDVWKFWPTGAQAAWALYATNNRFIARNGFLKLNTSPLREAIDLTPMTISTAAGSGIVAASMVLTPGVEQIAVELAAPELPTGWTISNAWALAIANVDPQTETTTDIVSASVAAAPYDITLAGLTTAQEYLVGGWFEFTKNSTEKAYGLSLQDLATPT